MPPSFVDTHIHLEEVPDWPAAVDEAVQAGVTGLIAMGTDLSTSRGAIASVTARAHLPCNCLLRQRR